MASTRFHNAARDGYLDLLRDATRRDCNADDEDGMTPVMWAAACGNLDALRMLVGRGGDPNKSDFYGNTALHCAAANNQMNCVSYLVNFGVNLFALENEYHTAKELAGVKGHNEILRYLDAVISKQSALNAKTVQKQKEKAIVDAEKRIHEMEKLQKKTTKKAEKDEKKMAKERSKMTTTVVVTNDADSRRLPSIALSGTGNFAAQRKETRQSFESPTFSDIVNNASGRGTVTGTNTLSAARKGLTGVSKKILQTKRNNKNNSNNADNTDFKVRETESDGRHSVRSLSGLRRDNEVLYVPKYTDTQSTTSSSGDPHRKRLQDIFDTTGGRIPRIASEPFLPAVGILDDGQPHQQQQSLFERPGFGNVAFRKNSLSGTLLSITKDFEAKQRNGDKEESGSRFGKSSSTERRSRSSDSDSIGSAGSLANRNLRGVGGGDLSVHDWINEEGDDDDDDDDDGGTLATFLAAHELQPCLHQLKQEQIDLKALLLLNESDLKELGFSLGTRKKLMDAIVRRKDALKSAGEVYDSRL